MIYEVRYYNISYLFIFFPDIRKRFDGIKKTLTALAEKCPDLKDAYNVKIDRALKFTQNFHNRELVNQVLDEVEKILDEIEMVLRKVKEGRSNPVAYT